MIKGMLVCEQAKLAVGDDVLSLYTGRFSSSKSFIHPQWEQNTHPQRCTVQYFYTTSSVWERITHKTLSSEKILHI